MAASREATVEPFIALPGTLFEAVATAAAAAASAFRAAESLRFRDLISDLESLREVVRAVSLVWRVSAFESLVSSCFLRLLISFEASLCTASSALRLAMSWSAAEYD